jgi:hypothetical protein
MDVYKVGVQIALHGNMAQSLSAMSHQLIGIHRSVQQINSSLGGWRKALIGAASIMGGSMMLGGLAKIARHGEEILDQTDKLIRAGRTHAEVANITAARLMRKSRRLFLPLRQRTCFGSPTN